MVDCSYELNRYWDEKVKLPQKDYDELMQKRDLQIGKLKANLQVDNFPQAIEFVNQGSYAMKTLIQQSEEYDLNIGVVFDKNDLISENKLQPSSIKYYVGQKLKIKRFLKLPSVMKNCIRVNYKENYHIAMPIFRKDENILELATTKGWESSNPQNINRWFAVKKCRVLFIPNTTHDIVSQEKHRIKIKNLYEKLNGYFNGVFNGVFKEKNFSDKDGALKIWKQFFNDNYFLEYIK